MTRLEQKKVTLAGILVPDQWAEDGEITGFALCTDDERKYVLNCNNKKNNLSSMLHQNIKVSGTMTGEAEKESIKVTTLQPLSSQEIEERDARGKAFCC
ncbi:hypothetical protein UWK_00597 [Desulfocapsa sulfexigens DSM 10523]|uniref:Uncharacterized protein n=1 Tax=Desulfocapsa sulfexigens (strain DSM 10523 / SB164P1) TaxID=1167006 RepID=M1P0X6_DESSD|nr:hypothetical protein [Desulfocapsa sulfexigens]AGF77178.1 hypothetical protein UWK_00597 [Desulfocapsa sulfexigens DSM 10523]